MKAVTSALLTGLVACGAVTAASAHHSFPATYHVDQTQTITGKVVAFLFRNPHSFVQVMAPDKSGQTQRWAVEWSAGAALADDHVTATTLKVGDIVTVTGNPARDETAHKLRMNKIVRRGDGWNWQGTVQ
jgi:hypothetical protein